MGPPRRPLTRSRSAVMKSSGAGVAEGSGGRKRSLVEEGYAPESRRITIDIAGPGGISMFRIPIDMPMHKLLKSYCEYKHLEYLAMKFLDPEGRRLQVRRTPEELHLADGDEITALVYSGGA